MALWRITDGPHPHEGSPDDLDAERWYATIENADEPAKRKTITVVLTGQARKLTPQPETVRRAFETHGVSAIEAFLGDRDPHAAIVVGADGISALRQDSETST